MLLLLSVTSLQACVIPLGPDFQDPPAQRNFPPQILKATPQQLTEVTDTKPTFTVTVTDPNVGDDLFIRWFSDFPGTPNTLRRLVPPEGSIIRANGTQRISTVSLSPTCSADLIARGFSLHTIVVMIGDRDFADLPDDRTQLVDGSHAVLAAWLLNLDCPPL